jgi:hypothetical protein
MKSKIFNLLCFWLIALPILSQTKYKVIIGNPDPVSNNQGDTWVAAFANGDTIYSPSNDTKGFYTFFQTFNSNIAFNKVIVKMNDLSVINGITVNQMDDYGTQGFEGPDACNWKSSGCYAVDGAIYWVVARHKYGDKSGDPLMRQPAMNASIIKSYDFGKTWFRSAKDNYDKPMFPGSRFSTPYFIQYGTDGSSIIDNADKYIYAVSNNGFWDNGDNLILGRVLKSKIAELDANDWQFYIGGDGLNDKSWSHDMNLANLIIDNPDRLGMSGIVYNPSLKKYLYIGWYYPAGGGKLPKASQKTVWDFYESDKPWGPWKRFDSYEFEPQGYYSPQICPKFISADGKKLKVFTAGDWNNDLYYRLTVVPIEIIDK